MFTSRKHRGRELAVHAYLPEFERLPGYLDFARFGPPSLAVTRAAAGFWTSASVGDIDEGAESDRACRAAARLTGFRADGVALVPSTSLGLFHVAFALRGAEVAVSHGEFPANLYPWWRAEELGILNVREMPGERLTAPVTPDRVADALRPSTTAVAVSAVDFRTGWRADLEGIREVIGDRLLIVDAIQAMGVVDMPWGCADVVVAGGQKWLRTGWGTGFVACSPRALAAMTPRLSGWTGVQRVSGYDGMRHPLAAGVAPIGVTNGSPASARMLAVGVELVESAGVTAIEARVSHRVDLLIAALDAAGIEVASPRSAADRAGIVVARWRDGSAADRWARLRDHGIRATLHGPDRVRFAVHATTNPGDLERAAAIAGDPR